LYVYILPSFLLYSFSYSFYLSVLMLNFCPHCNSKTLGFPSITDYHYLCRFCHHVARIAYCVVWGFFQQFSELRWMLSISIVSVWYFIINVTILMWSKPWNKQGIKIIQSNRSISLLNTLTYKATYFSSTERLYQEQIHIRFCHTIGIPRVYNAEVLLPMVYG
jgi:hypothetical protein